MKIIQMYRFRMDHTDYVNVKIQIKKYGIKMKNLAKQCGISRQGLYEMLKGHVDISENAVRVLRDNGILIPFTGIERERTYELQQLLPR